MKSTSNAGPRTVQSRSFRAHCAAASKTGKRGQTKLLLRDRDSRFPGRVGNMFKAMVDVMSNVAPSHLMERNLDPFAGLQTTGVADSGGDHAFDDDDNRGPASATAIPIHHPS